MTAEPPGSPVTEGVRSLEVRWIFLGELEPATAGWFARFPAWMESREDAYLLDPQLPGLSVKVRGGGALEVKAYRGSPGILEVPSRARGRMEFWQKWSFPFSPLRPGSDDSPGWGPVAKRRRISRFSSAGGPVVARGRRCTTVRLGPSQTSCLDRILPAPYDLDRVEHLHDNTSTRITVATTRPGGAESRRDSDTLDLLGYTTGTHEVRNTPRTINSLQRTKPSKCGASIDFRR